MSTVRDWLTELGLDRYSGAFEAADIDWEVLPELTDDDLRELGVSLGHRKKFLKAIRIHDAEVEAAPVESPAPVQSERRQVTVLFADLVGSTALAEALDPEDMAELIRGYQSLCAETVGRFGGHVAKYLGDGVMAYFGYDGAHENDVERAVRAGLEIAERLPTAMTSPDGPLRARVGIATGRVVVGDVDEGLVTEKAAIAGSAPNLAARLQGLADPGMVVIADASKQILGRQFEMTAVGEQHLKGFEAPVVAWCVVGEAQSNSRFDALHGARLSSYVGRDSEQTLLRDRWNTALDGEGQAVLVSGEAGIGKSRILRRFREQIGSEGHSRLLYQCSQLHENSAFYPIIAQLERAAGIDRRAPAGENLDRLEHLFALDSENAAEVIPVFAELLSLANDGRYAEQRLSPERRRELILTALVTQLRGLAAEQPALLIFEDLHWADEASLELMRHILGAISELPVLLLVTTRPEGVGRLPEAPHLSHLSLARLSKRQGAALTRDVAGAVEIPADVVDAIVARSDGIPLYVEEVTKAVIEGGQLDIPASLQDSLAARLDRLGAAKETAQLASVVGRIFDRALLLAASPKSQRETEQDMDALRASELVFARSGAVEGEYEFKHALVQDAAYQSLLRANRHALHKRVADAMERNFPERCRSEPAVVAHHMIEGNVSDRAVEYLLQAGKELTAASAFVPACETLEKGLTLLLRRPEGSERDRLELEFQTSLAPPLQAVKGYAAPEAEAAYQRAQELMKRLDTSEFAGPVLNGYCTVLYNLGRLEELYGTATELLQEGERAHSHEMLTAGHRLAGAAAGCMGQMSEYERHTNLAVHHLDEEAYKKSHWRFPHNLAAGALAQHALASWLVGLGKRAIDLQARAYKAATDANHGNTLGYTFVFAGVYFGLMRRDRDGVVEAARKMVKVGRKQNLQVISIWGMGFAANDERANNDPDGTIDAIREQIAALKKIRHVWTASEMHQICAEILFEHGRYDEALAELEATLAENAKTKTRWLEADTLCLKSRVLAKRDGASSDGARNAARHALVLAREQGSKMFEMRAAAQCAEVAGNSTERNEARDALASVYHALRETALPEDLDPYEKLVAPQP